MDMTYAFLKHFYGKDDKEVDSNMNAIEFAPHTDPHWDPFSVVHDASFPLSSCCLLPSLKLTDLGPRGGRQRRDG
jgi:hypothetical protein